jgi:CubicO group peptidase (beta-lactamase class C family)
MLEDEGKLSLTDDIKKYIPDYPTDGKNVTIHHLLNHTSGIKDYSSMDNFDDFSKKELTAKELIDVFKNEPWDFEPGTQFQYSNSGYIILGYIIEAITNKSFADFVNDNIFKPLNMTSSYYPDKNIMIPNEANGFSIENEKIIEAEYLSPDILYAAGALMSTTEDLLKWQNALIAERLIKNSTFDKAANGSTLSDGTKINYGYGLISGVIKGSKTIEHSGQIFGFNSTVIYLPTEDTYVIVLANSDNPDLNIGGFARKIATIAIEKDTSTKKTIPLVENELKKWVGEYKFNDDVIRTITVSNGKIFSQREGAYKNEILATSTNSFIFPSGSTYTFEKKNGEIKVLFTSSNGTIVLGKKISENSN